MTSEKLSELTATTTPALTDILLTTVDPSGTPASRKVTNQNIANLYLSDHMLFVATATATLANSTSETSIIGTGVGSLTLAAAYLNTIGKTVRATGYGFISTTGTPTLTTKFKLGSTVIASTGAVTTASGLSLALLSFDILLTCRTTGATGTVIASGVVGIGTTVNVLYPTSGTTTTLDLTATQAASVTGQWSAASASNTLSIVNFTLQKLN